MRIVCPARLGIVLALVASAAAVHGQPAGQRATDEAACAKGTRATDLPYIACMIGRGHPMALEANGKRIELHATFRGETDLVLSDIKLCENEAKIEESDEERRRRLAARNAIEPQLAVFMDCMLPRGYAITGPRPVESR